MHIPDTDSFAATFASVFGGMDTDLDHLPDTQDLPEVDDELGSLDADDYGDYGGYDA